MSREISNKDLAKLIVKQLAVFEKIDGPFQSWMVRIQSIGISTPIGKTKDDKELGLHQVDLSKKEAESEIEKYICSELDSGNIQLSDSWFDENIRLEDEA